MAGDSSGAWDSLRVLGGGTGGLKVNPHDYIHGGCWPFGPTSGACLQGQRPSWALPHIRLLVGVPSRASPRPFGLQAAPAALTGLALSGARQHYQPTGSAARAPCAPAGIPGAFRRNQCARLRIRGSSWIFGINGCNVARRNEKTRRKAGSSEALGGDTPWLRVTGSGEPCYQNTSQVCVMKARVSSKFPQPCYRWPLPLALCRICMDWIQELLPCRREVGPNEGDSAHGPIAQQRTPAQTHTRQA